MHQIEYLCPNCTPEIITVLVRYNSDDYYCTRCTTHFKEEECIASNYTWLYIEDDKEFQ